MAKRNHATAENQAPTHWGDSSGPDSLDTTPLEMPLGAQRPESLQATIARLVAQQIDEERNEQHESWEEANDFEPEDEDLLNLTDYTVHDEEFPMNGNPFVDEVDTEEPAQPENESSGDQQEEAPQE